MAMRVETDPLEAAYAVLLEHGLDGAGEALRILVNEAAKIERAQYLGAQPYERTEIRRDYANGYKPKTMLTRFGNMTFQVPQVRSGDFYPSALEKGTATSQAVNLALAEMYVQGVSTRRLNRGAANSSGQTCNCLTPRSAALPRNSMPASKPGASVPWGRCPIVP